MSSTTGSTLEPFTDAEHAERLERVRARMAERGIDVLYVTSPANLVWLCGYEASWYPPRLPLGAAVHGATGEVVWFDWSRHEDYARAATRCDAFVWFEYEDATDVVAATLRDRGWVGGTVGVERATLNPSPAIVLALEEAIRATGATVTGGDWVVDGARTYKTPAEVQRVRAAAAMADAAMAGLRERLRPGMTELQVSALLGSLLADEGSEIAATPVLVSSGPTAWRDVHAFPSRRVLEAGDVVSVDCCGVVDRYHANLSRTFVLGDDHAGASALLNAAHGAVLELQRRAEPGADPAPAMAAAEAWARERIPAENLWWVGGYGLGIALPPSWVGHTYLANDGPEKITLQPGYLSNFETVLVDRAAGFEACCIDTLLMTEDGLELLSKLPRELLTASGG
jgi:Xaa-Pro aminopeptidase